MFTKVAPSKDSSRRLQLSSLVPWCSEGMIVCKKINVLCLLQEELKIPPTVEIGTYGAAPDPPPPLSSDPSNKLSSEDEASRSFGFGTITELQNLTESGIRHIDAEEPSKRNASYSIMASLPFPSTGAEEMVVACSFLVIPYDDYNGGAYGEGGGLEVEVRRRAVLPSLHIKFLSVMVNKVFCRCALRLVEKLRPYAINGASVNMEEKFSQLTLDVIGLSLFNYNFDSLTSDSPVIDAVYTALKEAESRSTDILPYWKAHLLRKIIPRQIKAEKAVTIIRETVEELIAKCKEIVDAEGEQINGEDYVNDSDPSILRFLLATRDEVSSVQLRDHLLSMLVAGHETTGSVLTWTLYLLSKDSSALAKAQEEVDNVLGGKFPTYDDVKELKYLTRCIHESMRLYPHPPVLIRRALVADVLPGNFKINVGQDIMISVYNIHRSPQVWDGAEDFMPERFDLEGPVPNETNTNFRFIPFSGGPRKCVGDQFALLEAIIALTIFLQNLNFELVPDQKIGMTTGATIHTTNVGFFGHYYKHFLHFLNLIA
ncbi:hypothetical protein IEQ34_010436 [Dendrobium chrysotoxum]|uniref:Uncharacterized protein n=1 Tax=Dendrobium chrysotoxum TaxID=161865 RepID=A0AAV7H341_DENCH|nr:hypothetical protein IEQ34_010436 [Dendrobium chrysotoxum]